MPSEIKPGAGQTVLETMGHIDPSLREVHREIARRALLALHPHELDEVLDDVGATRAERDARLSTEAKREKGEKA